MGIYSNSHPLFLHRGLSEQNDIESCKYKLEVCKDLYNIEEEEYLDKVEEYLDKVDCSDEFFHFMWKVEERWYEHCQEDDYYRLWYWFLRQSIRELKYTIAIKSQELEKSEYGPILFRSEPLRPITTHLVMAKWFDITNDRYHKAAKY